MDDHNNLFNNSQSIPLENNSTTQDEIRPSREIVTMILERDCDSRDLLAAYHIGAYSRKHGKGADISDVMSIMKLSNPAANIRLRKMSGDLKAGGLKIPILVREKIGPYGSYLYRLNEKIITLEELQGFLVSMGIHYEDHIAQLQDEHLPIADSENALSKEERASELNTDEAELLEDCWTDSDDLSAEESWDSDEVLGKKEKTEISQSEIKTEDSAPNDIDISGQPIPNNFHRSRYVTHDELIKIVDTITELLIEQFDKKIAQRDARIMELERQLAVYQDSQHGSINDTEEILNSVRSSILSKIGNSKHNGKAHN